MKFTKAIILLAIIAIAACAENDRSERKAGASLKAKAKITSQMCKNYIVTVQIDNDTANLSSGTITGTTMKTPTGDQTKGLFLKFTTITDALKALLVVSGDSYYLSYRQLLTSFDSAGTDFGGKYLTVSLSADKVYSIRINFEYDPQWTIIEDSEVIQILSWLNTARSSRQALISGYKRDAQTFANDYYTNSQSLTAAQSGIAGIEARITAANTEISGYTTQKAADEKSASDLATQIATKEAELLTLQNTLSTTNSDINTKSAEITACNNAIISLQAQKDGKDAGVATYKTQMDTASNNLVTYFANLSTECPKDTDNIAAAKTAILTNNDKTTMDAKLALIIS
jgi:predicted  nucleic acid-binding Zn-ribbon protein